MTIRPSIPTTIAKAMQLGNSTVSFWHIPRSVQWREAKNVHGPSLTFQRRFGLTCLVLLENCRPGCATCLASAKNEYQESSARFPQYKKKVVNDSATNQ